MCGIVGIVVKGCTGLFKQTEDSFMQMLYADALRGEDSTGIIGVEKDSTFHISKESSSADYFLFQYARNKEKQIKEAMYNRGRAYIGHNRKRTQGAISDENAHPFVIENDFAFVHNGTLYNHSQLAKNCEVDSQALAIHMRAAIRTAGDSMGKIKASLEDAMSEVSGAYATAFYDQTTHRVYLLRNKDRPLAMIETHSAWYFMSEPLMGAWILSRNGYDYDKMKAVGLGEHELVMFDMDQGSADTKMYKEQLTLKKFHSPSNNQGHSWGGAHHGTNTGESGGKEKTPTNVTADKGGRGKPMKSDKDLKKFRKDWLGRRIAFWVDDYLEHNIGRTVDGDGESKVTLMGGHEDCSYWHNIMADVDLHSLNIHYSEEIGKNKWSGVVGAIGVTKAGVIQIYLEGSKPMIESKTVMAAIADSQIEKSKKFREELGRLTAQELDIMYEEKKYNWAPWQITAANAERSFRMGIKDIEQAARVCKMNENGYVLVQIEHHDGHYLYIGSTGRVYYESAVTLH